MGMPLSIALRPNTLSEIVGQSHLVGEHGIFTKMRDTKIQNVILWGPPGSGKTTIAYALANETNSHFVKLNATYNGIKDLRAVIKEASAQDKRTILAVDEIHRWPKNVQDVLLPAIEDGTIILIGLTVETANFAVIKALTSRCLILETESLDDKHIAEIFRRAYEHYKAQKIKIKIDRETLECLIKRSGGDARKIILATETLVEIMCDNGKITKKDLDIVLPHKHLVFDSTGTEHYDYAQNLQCAIQCSDVNSAIYWLARSIASSEDPRYIARRLLVSASEDACSNPHAALVAHNAYVAAKEVGYPECQIILAHAVIEITKSERNRSANDAISKAMSDVRNGVNVVAVHSNSSTHVSSAGYTKVDAEYV